MVIAHLVLQPQLYGIGWQWMLEMGSLLLKVFISSEYSPVRGCFHR